MHVPVMTSFPVHNAYVFGGDKRIGNFWVAGKNGLWVTSEGFLNTFSYDVFPSDLIC